jgi:hypothetical protein
MADSAQLAVNAQSPAVQTMAAQWTVLDTLLGGTPEMRKASTKYLPQWPAEESAAYCARLEVSTLFPAYRRTVGVMSGKPFAKALTLEDADARIEGWCENVDTQGVNLHSFASEMFEESFAGLAGILVDFPDARPRDAQGRVAEGPQPKRTLAQAEAAGLRPYFVRVMHNQLLGWRTGKDAQGRTILTQLRLREDTEVDDGEYGTKCVERVRVLRPGSWELLELTTDKMWVRLDGGNTSLSEIPFVPLYGRRRGFMDGAPVLLDLAYLNVKHWQSQSDQDTILHAARVPILAMIGAETETQLVIGASTAVKLPLTADMKWVEHSGAAIGAGGEALAALEDHMIQTGAELLVKKPGDRSATEAAGDAEANKCDLQRMTEQFEDALDQALVFMAQYGGVDPSRAGSVSLFKDFGAATLSDASAQLVADLNSRGILSRETTLRELQRRGVIEASVNVEDEIAKAEAEGPALGELSLQVSGDAARAAAEAAKGAEGGAA